MEYWKHIDGYNKKYMISSLGRVMSNKQDGSGKILNPSINNAGYLAVSLYDNGVQNRMLVHRLVANHFIDNTFLYPHVNHKDGDKLNNMVENLEWCDRSQNMKHAVNSGVMNVSNHDTHPRSTKIIVMNTGQVFPSLTKCAKEYGVSITTIQRVLEGKPSNKITDVLKRLETDR